MKATPALFNGPMIRALAEGRKSMTRRPMKVQPHGNLCGYKSDLGYPASEGFFWAGFGNPIDPSYYKSPYGQPGDLIWVREKWAKSNSCHDLTIFYAATDGDIIQRPLDYSEREKRWRPSIHMPQWASRLTLKITAVRAERVQDITEKDAIAEGMFFTDYGRNCHHGGGLPRDIGDCPAPKSTHPQRNGWSYKNTTHQDQCLGLAATAFANLWNSIYATPQPRKTGGIITHYESYPWDESSRDQRTKINRVPHICYPNPYVFATTFNVIKANVDTLI